MADVVELYRRAVDEFGRRVQAVAPDQWGAPTPDAEWDVRALVGHVMNENQWVPPLLEGLTIEEVGDRFEGDQLGPHPAAAWAAAAEAAVAACEPDDVPVRPVHVSFGDITAEDYLAQVTADHVVHSWDLARAIGGDEDVDPELVDFAYGFLAPQAESWRAAGAFGPAVKAPPPGSGRLYELLALTGRDPLGTGELADVDEPEEPSEADEPEVEVEAEAEDGSDRLRADLALLAAQARSIQAELDSYTTTRNHYWPTKAEEWVTDIGRYDRVLITMAVMLGYPVPPTPPQGAQRRLSREERAAMQALLAENDIDVGAPKTS